MRRPTSSRDVGLSGLAINFVTLGGTDVPAHSNDSATGSVEKDSEESAAFKENPKVQRSSSLMGAVCPHPPEPSLSWDLLSNAKIT